TRYANRMDFNVAAGVLPTNKYRITTIGTGTGGELDVTYEGSDCTPAAPPNPDNNASRCFPPYYFPPRAPGAGPRWWNKSRASQFVERDLVGGSPDMPHSYSSSTAGSSTPVLWHHDDAAWGSGLAKRSWSVWRGYSSVTVTDGPGGGPQS